MNHQPSRLKKCSSSTAHLLHEKFHYQPSTFWARLCIQRENWALKLKLFLINRKIVIRFVIKWSLIALIGNYTITLYSCYPNATLARTLSQNLQDLSRSLAITDSRAAPCPFNQFSKSSGPSEILTFTSFCSKRASKCLCRATRYQLQLLLLSSVYSFSRSKIISFFEDRLT